VKIQAGQIEDGEMTRAGCGRGNAWGRRKGHFTTDDPPPNRGVWQRAATDTYSTGSGPSGCYAKLIEAP